MMDLILYNGQILTMKNKDDQYSAIAIKNGKVAAIGHEDVAALDANKKIDLKGQYVCPGFNDSHIHLLGLGAAISLVDLTPAKSIQDVISITKAYIEKHNLPKNTWVMGRGWNQDYFDVSVMPTHKDLDKISTEHYIFLRRTCGHMAVANTYLCEHYHFGLDFTEIDGGSYESGVFKENAIDLVNNCMPVPTKHEIKNWILAGEHYLNTLGITSVQSDDLCVFHESLNDTVFESFKELDQESQHTLKVYEQSLFRNLETLKKAVSKGYKQNEGSDFFKQGPLKILGDGALGGRTAWLNKPYEDDPSTTGIHMYSQEELDNYVAFAHDHDIASAIHCIGDRMLDSALDAIEKSQKNNYKPYLRHGIVHCQLTSKEQLERIKSLNVMAYVQPIFLDYDAHIVYDRVGSLANTSYAWQTMMNMNITMAFGSDAPVDSADPIKGMHCAITRKGLDLTPEEGYLPQEAMTTFDVLKYYTTAGAYTSYEENEKGLLLPGFVADIVVLNGDIYKNILACEVDMTIVNGKIVYKKTAR